MTRAEIESRIRYEEHKGIHTYHVCPYCGANPTRAGRCADCLRKMLEGEK